MGSDSTFQELLSSFSKDVFVGRSEQLTLFEKALDAPRPSFLILGISGQGGVGKTTLLERFQNIAEAHKAHSALVNEDITNVPDVLSSFAKQLTASGLLFKNFNERYMKYRELKNEVEGDIDAPQGLLNFALQSATRIGLRTLKHIPVAGDVADVLLSKEAENEVAKEVSTFATYIAQKFSNKDDRTLMLETLLELSKVFISDFNNNPSKEKIILFFDTYEKTSLYLDDWLQHFIGGAYGTFSSRTLFCIAGRNSLSQTWTKYSGAIRQIELSKFTETEAREYLTRSGVTNEKDVLELLRLSDSLPVLLAFLVTTPGKIPTDLSSTAVERFLNGTTPQQREAALALSVPRIFNKDLLSIILGEQGSDPLFDWISSSHFVRSGSDGWYYHEVVRSLLLKYFHLLSIQEYFEIHQKVETYYDEQIKQLSKSAKAPLIDSLRKFKTEIIYHKISQGKETSLAEILDSFLENLKEDSQYTKNLIQSLEQVGDESDSNMLKSWARDLAFVINTYSKKKINKEDLQKALSITSRILSESLSSNSISRVYELRGIMFDKNEDSESAITAYSSAIENWSDRPEYFHQRAHAYEEIRDFQSAMADFTKSIELKPDENRYYKCRGNCHLFMGNYTSAIDDISTAIKLDPEDHTGWHSRAHYYLLTENYPAAKADFLKAIEIKPDVPDNYACYARMLFDTDSKQEAIKILTKGIKIASDDIRLYQERVRYYTEIENFKSALADINKIMKLEPGKDSDYYSRGYIKRNLSQNESALKDFNTAIAINPIDPNYYHERAHTLENLGRNDEALMDFTKAIELAPDVINNYYCRSRLCTRIGKLKMALDDTNRVISSNNSAAELFIIRGQLHQALGNKKAANQDFDKAVRLEPIATCYYARAKFNETVEKNKKALEDYSKAIELESKSAILFHDRAHLYEKLSLNQKAIEDFSNAIKLEPENAKHFQCRGASYFSKNNDTQAESDFKQAISLNPNNDDNYYFLARILERRGDNTQAIEELNRAIELKANDSINLAWRGYVYTKLGALDSAMRDFSQLDALGKDLISPGAYYISAIGYCEMHKNKIALRHLSEAFEKDKNLIEKAMDDEKLKNLRRTKGFQSLIKKHRIIKSKTGKSH